MFNRRISLDCLIENYFIKDNPIILSHGDFLMSRDLTNKCVRNAGIKSSSLKYDLEMWDWFKSTKEFTYTCMSVF